MSTTVAPVLLEPGSSQVTPAVPVEIGDGNAGLDHPEGELAETAAPHPGVVEDVRHGNAGLGGRKDRKGLAARGGGGTRRQRDGGVIGGGGQGGRAEEHGGGERGF